MIIYHKSNEIDREQWDNCIKHSHAVKPYGYSWYLDIMSPGWEALVDDDYDSVFPIPGRSALGIKYVATPVFLQQLGAFSPDKPASEALKEFLYYMPDFYRLIDLCVGHKPEHDGFRITEKSNYVLDISKPYENLWLDFTSHCKRNVEAAAKVSNSIRSDITPDELIDLFIRNKGKEIKGIRGRDYQRLRNLMNFCIKNRKGRIVGVRSGKKNLTYGMFIVETHANKTLLFIVNTLQSREKRTGYYVLNELIKEHASSRTLIDFAGSSIPSVAAFMESFGSVNRPFYRLYRNRLLWPVRILK